MEEKKRKPDSVKERKVSTMQGLKQFGEDLYNQIETGEFPWIKMPSRSTSNILYDDRLRQFILGNKNVRRSSRNIRHIRPFTQLVWVASFAHELSNMGKTSTLRDVYYSAQAFDVNFKDQQESDNIITDLETILGLAREDFSVFPEERSEIFGDLTIEYTIPRYEGRRVNLTMHPDGLAIGPALTSAEFIETSADKVIVIEKGAMFNRLIEEQAYKQFNAILIHTAGQPPRATRHIVKRLNVEKGLPVYVFCDADPWGMAIATTIIYGSVNAAHLKELATPGAKWMGLYSSDIEKYKLSGASEKLENIDIKRLYDMQKDPRCKEEPWKSEIEDFLKHKRKCELEAFSRYGLDFVVTKYLPDKLSQL